MGMSASQVRFLSLQSRKNSVGRELMTLSNRKLALSRDMNNVARKYTSALNNMNLKFSKDGGKTFETIDYDLLMKPNELNYATPYIVSDRNGRVVLDNVANLVGGMWSNLTSVNPTCTVGELTDRVFQYNGLSSLVLAAGGTNTDLTYENIARLITTNSNFKGEHGYVKTNGDGVVYGTANPGGYYIPNDSMEYGFDNTLRYQIFEELGLVKPGATDQYLGLLNDFYGSQEAQELGDYAQLLQRYISAGLTGADDVLGDFGKFSTYFGHYVEGRGYVGGCLLGNLALAQNAVTEYDKWCNELHEFNLATSTDLTFEDHIGGKKHVFNVPAFLDFNDEICGGQSNYVNTSRIVDNDGNNRILGGSWANTDETGIHITNVDDGLWYDRYQDIFLNGLWTNNNDGNQSPISNIQQFLSMIDVSFISGSQYQDTENGRTWQLRADGSLTDQNVIVLESDGTETITSVFDAAKRFALEQCTNFYLELFTLGQNYDHPTGSSYGGGTTAHAERASENAENDGYFEYQGRVSERRKYRWYEKLWEGLKALGEAGLAFVTSGVSVALDEFGVVDIHGRPLDELSIALFNDGKKGYAFNLGNVLKSYYTFYEMYMQAFQSDGDNLLNDTNSRYGATESTFFDNNDMLFEDISSLAEESSRYINNENASRIHDIRSNAYSNNSYRVTTVFDTVSDTSFKTMNKTVDKMYTTTGSLMVTKTDEDTWSHNSKSDYYATAFEKSIMDGETEYGGENYIYNGANRSCTYEYTPTKVTNSDGYAIARQTVDGVEQEGYVKNYKFYYNVTNDEGETEEKSVAENSSTLYQWVYKREYYKRYYETHADNCYTLYENGAQGYYYTLSDGTKYYLDDADKKDGKYQVYFNYTENVTNPGTANTIKCYLSNNYSGYTIAKNVYNDATGQYENRKWAIKDNETFNASASQKPTGVVGSRVENIIEANSDTPHSDAFLYVVSEFDYSYVKGGKTYSDIYGSSGAKASFTWGDYTAKDSAGRHLYGYYMDDNDSNNIKIVKYRSEYSCVSLNDNHGTDWDDARDENGRLLPTYAKYVFSGVKVTEYDDSKGLMTPKQTISGIDGTIFDRAVSWDSEGKVHQREREYILNKVITAYDYGILNELNNPEYKYEFDKVVEIEVDGRVTGYKYYKLQADGTYKPVGANGATGADDIGTTNGPTTGKISNTYAYKDLTVGLSGSKFTQKVSAFITPSSKFKEDLQQDIQNCYKAIEEAEEQRRNFFAGEERKLMDYYDAVFQRVAEEGWVLDTNINNKYNSQTTNTSKEYINNKLQNNDYLLTECSENFNKAGYRFASKLAANIKKIYEVHDDDSEEMALSQYQRDTKRIKSKEKAIDDRMVELETEQEVINTELESLKRVRDENITKKFKIFG